MLADMGIKWVVLGHSERRENCGETSQIASSPADLALCCLEFYDIRTQTRRL